MNTLYAKFKCTEIYVMHMICKKKKNIYIYIYIKKLKIFKCAFEKEGKFLFKFYSFNHKNFTMHKHF